MVFATVLSTEGVIGISSFVMLMMCLVAGFLVNYSSIPVFIRWTQYLSYYKYSFSGLMQVEFGGLTFYCTSSESVSTSGGEVCPFTSGNEIIKLFGADEFSILGCMLWLVGFILFFRILSYILLRWFARK